VIAQVIEARPRNIGLPVARVLPSVRRRAVGPFVFVDHMGPIELAPGAGFDVRPHPHIGLSTVTYFLAGENVHRDSLGTVQVNRPGDVNLMTAGAGVVHSERAAPDFRARGGLMHGVQIWLGLPEAHEDDAASFEHHPQATLPVIAPAPGATGRVLLGTAYGLTSPIRHPSSPWLVDLELDAGATLEITDEIAERGALVLAGAVDIDGTSLAVDHLALLEGPAALRAAAPSRVLLLGGPSLGPRLIEWNFVSSNRARIDRARTAWKAQTFPKIPGDDQEFVPLPEKP
jgi:redox-sensitive bicupin YhaK (pirin superfamily)